VLAIVALFAASSFFKMNVCFLADWFLTFQALGFQTDQHPQLSPSAPLFFGCWLPVGPPSGSFARALSFILGPFFAFEIKS